MVSVRLEQLMARLQEARNNLNLVLDRVPAGLWEQQIYSDGAQWTLRELLIHLMISDHGQNNVLMGIAEGKNIIPDDYDLNRYNSGSVSKRKEVSLEFARNALTESRQRLIDWLSEIDDSVLDKEGRHASMQILSIAQILDVMAQHEEGHTRDIEAMLAQKA